MQQPAQGGVLSTEMRHAMLAHIYQSINGTVRAVGRSEDAIQKYAQNIESTAAKSCNGNRAEYERRVHDLIKKIHMKGNQHQQAAGVMQQPQIIQQQQQQPQHQPQQQIMNVQAAHMTGASQYSNMNQYPAAQVALATNQVPMGQQFLPQQGMYNSTPVGQLNRSTQMQQQMQSQQQPMPIQQQQAQAAMQMPQQSTQAGMQVQQHMQHQQALGQQQVAVGGGGIMAQDSADPAFYDFLQELANEPSVPAKAKSAALPPQKQMSQPQMQQQPQMPGYGQIAQQPQQQQQQQTIQQQMGPASGGYAAMMQHNTAPQQQQQQQAQPVHQSQSNYTVGQQMQGMAGAQKVMNQSQGQMQHAQQLMMQQQGMQQPMMFVPQQQMAGGSYAGMPGMLASNTSMVSQQQQQQAAVGAVTGYLPQQQQQQQMQGQQQANMQQQQQQPGMGAAMQSQQAQQQVNQVQPGMAAQQQRMQSGVVMSGPASNGPASGSAAANKGAIAAAAAAAAAHGLASSQPRGIQGQHQQQQQQQQQLMQQQPQQQTQQPQVMQAGAPAAAAAVAGGTKTPTPAAAAAAARMNAEVYAAQKAATLAQVSALSPHARTVRYYQQLDELRAKFAKDLHELHQLLQAQRVTVSNKEKINGFIQRTHGLLHVLNMPRPVHADAAHHISPETYLQLLSMKKSCESMVSQLHAIKSKKPGMYKAVHTQQAAAPQHQGVTQQQQQQLQQGMGPPAAAGYAGAAATPDEVVSRPTVAPSPMGAGAAPSPAAGAAATAATPPIGVGAAAAAQMIKPDMPPAPVLPASVGSADMTKVAAAATAGGAAQTATVAAAAGGKDTPAAVVAGDVEKQPLAAARTLGGAVAGVAADTPLGKLYAAVATATEAQLATAGQQQVRALNWSAQSAGLGPLPSPADFAVATAAAAAGTPSDTSDGSAATVEAQFMDAPDWYTSVIDSRTIAERFPEGYQESKSRPPPAAASAAAAASDGLTTESQAAAAAAAAAGQGRKRHRQDLEEVCKQVEAELKGSVHMVVLLDTDGSSSTAGTVLGSGTAVSIQCIRGGTPAAAVTVKQESVKQLMGVVSGPSEKQTQPWKRLRLIVPEGYPNQPPVAVFDPASWSEAPSAVAGSEGVAVKTEAGMPAGSTGPDVEQQQWAQKAWHELQAALCEDPVADLKGLAQHWCQAVDVVTLQQGIS